MEKVTRGCAMNGRQQKCLMKGMGGVEEQKTGHTECEGLHVFNEPRLSESLFSQLAATLSSVLLAFLEKILQSAEAMEEWRD